MKKTTDIKIKKIKTIKIANDKVCSIWDQVEAIKTNKKTTSLVDFVKSKIAYIFFGFMISSIALYIFFITSVIVFAVQERSYIFLSKQIELPLNKTLDDKKDFQEKIVMNNQNNENKIIYIKRTNNTNSLSTR